MINVAIVEDIATIREAITSMVKDNNDMLCIHVFSNAEDALITLSDDPMDVVLMDIQLPGISGIECVRQLKLKHPGMQFIMCTILQDDENIFSALRAGAAGYLLKGDENHKIMTAIIDVYNGGSPMNAQIARRVIESFQTTRNQASRAEVELTSRENELLMLLAKGYRYKEIAARLYISVETVRKHINNIYKKLHVQSRMDAVNKVFGEKY